MGRRLGTKLIATCGMCKDKLEEEIKMEKVIEILQLADLHGVRELKRECLEFIKSNSGIQSEGGGKKVFGGNHVHVRGALLS